MTPPPQHMQALEQANLIRLSIAAERRDVAARRKHIADVILDPPPALAKVPVGKAIIWAPRVGAHKMRRVFVRTRISEARSLGTLTDRERRELVGLIDALLPYGRETACAD